MLIRNFIKIKSLLQIFFFFLIKSIFFILFFHIEKLQFSPSRDLPMSIIFMGKLNNILTFWRFSAFPT